MAIEEMEVNEITQGGYAEKGDKVSWGTPIYNGWLRKKSISRNLRNGLSRKTRRI